MVFSTWRVACVASAALRITRPTSLFCSCERMSRFMEPMTERYPSMMIALECRLARELLLPLEPPAPPNQEPRLSLPPPPNDQGESRSGSERISDLRRQSATPCGSALSRGARGASFEARVW